MKYSKGNKLLLIGTFLTKVVAFAPLYSAARRGYEARMSPMEEPRVNEEGFDSLINKSASGARQDYEERTERISLDISKTTYSSLVKSPPDAYVSFAEKGASNAHQPKRKILHQSILGGCYVGFGGLIALMVAGNMAGIAGPNPGLAKMAFAALFPVNLLLIVNVSTSSFQGSLASPCPFRLPVSSSPGTRRQSLLRATKDLSPVVTCG